VLVVLCTLSIALFPQQPAAAQDASLSPQAQQILDAVNQARLDNGLPALTLSPLLTLAAQRHVDDVIANGNWGHYGSDGSNVRLRVARVGYSTSSVSENWVAVSDPGQAIGWWMNDWIHRVNILEPRWDEVGVGAAQASNGFWILVTDFGNIDGGAMPPIVEAAPVTQLTADGDITTEAIPQNGEYAIQSGDTLLGIAYRFGLDWQDIALTNDMGENDLLQIGQVIRLPIPNGVGGAVQADNTGVVAGKQVHVVRTGETLWTIAARYQIAWEDVAVVNDLGEYDLLQIGQELKLPASLDEPEEVENSDANEADGENGDSVTAAAEEQSGDGTEEASAESETVPADTADEGTRFAQKSAAAATYTVKSGDTLLAIAIKLDIEWEELANANDLTEDSFLQIGQELKVPGAAPTLMSLKDSSDEPGTGFGSDTKAAAAASSNLTHRVTAGDTIYGIALEYGADMDELLRLNDLDEDTLLQLDQEILLP
jgi:LysM repeat protein